MLSDELLFIKVFYEVLWVILLFQIIISFCQHSALHLKIHIWNNFFSVILIVYASFYLGTRDVIAHTDTGVYLEYYNYLTTSFDFWNYGEPIFYFLMALFAHYFPVEYFFTFCAFVYIGGAYICMKRFFSSSAIYSLLLFFISPFFFLCGINVIRNGFAASLFLLSFYWLNRNNKKMYTLMIVASLCHYSMFIVLFVFILSKYIKSNFALLCIWGGVLLFYLINIRFSSFLGGIFNINESVENYLMTKSDEPSASLMNFFTYSASPVFLSCFFIYVKKYKDTIYLRLLNMYIILNIFYILVMDIQFAVRFSYLSGFLMPIVLVYPLIKVRIIPLRLWILSLFLAGIFLIKSSKILF